ncbi:MAG: PDZ domain-containing protein [Candidatus Cloacimonetes bacterium]|nr:PDZ domain-containing protein [Candidatus Cloacimonadota bacterium]
MAKTLQLLSILLLLLIASTLYSTNNAYLGVYLEDLTELERRDLQLDNGVRINMVIAGSPADENGLMPNDIIVKINDMPITSQDQVRTIIQYANPGDILKIYVFSAGHNKVLEVTLGNLQTADTSRIKFIDTKTKHIGVKFQHLTDQLKDFFQIKHGVLIVEVFPDSPAEQAGLKAGDVIVMVERKPIYSIRDIKEIIKSKKAGEIIVIDFVRNGTNHQTKVVVVEADEFFSLDMSNEIIILGKQEFDISDINRWLDSVFSDTERKEMERRIKMLQEEINQIQRKLQEEK